MAATPERFSIAALVGVATVVEGGIQTCLVTGSIERIVDNGAGFPDRWASTDVPGCRDAGVGEPAGMVVRGGQAGEGFGVLGVRRDIAAEMFDAQIGLGLLELAAHPHGEGFDLIGGSRFG